jgi:uncharacterized phosphosugar-binding protein
MSRQIAIPGTESKIPSAVRAAGDAYVSEASKTAKAKKKSDEAKAVLIAAMQKHEIETFRDDEADPPVIISATLRHGIRVSKLKKQHEGDDESGEAEA